MKLLRYGPKGKEKPGILDKNGKIRDLSKVIPDITGETLAGQRFVLNDDAGDHRTSSESRTV